MIQEVRRDAELRRWLDWPAGSANSRNAKMGRWYLRQLEKDLPADATVFATVGVGGAGLRPVPPGVTPGGRAKGIQACAVHLSAGVHFPVPFGATPNGTGATPVPPLVIYVDPESGGIAATGGGRAGAAGGRNQEVERGGNIKDW